MNRRYNIHIAIGTQRIAVRNADEYLVEQLREKATVPGKAPTGGETVFSIQQDNLSVVIHSINPPEEVS